MLEGGAKVHIYSRNAEDMTPRYPDIVSRLRSWLTPGTASIVLDGEAVAWDPDKSKILPFQVLSTRARKEVALADVKVQVCRAGGGFGCCNLGLCCAVRVCVSFFRQGGRTMCTMLEGRGKAAAVTPAFANLQNSAPTAATIARQ